MDQDDPALGDVVVSQAAIARRVADLGAQITTDYAGRAPLLVGVLRQDAERDAQRIARNR